MWWIFISIVFALILYVSTRNLAEYGGKGKGFIPVKFPIWGLLLLIISLLIPILNILAFVVCIVLIFIAVSMGTKYTYDGKGEDIPKIISGMILESYNRQKSYGETAVTEHNEHLL